MSVGTGQAGDVRREAPGVAMFHRPARVFPEPFPREPVVLAAPPTVPQGDRGSALQLLLPIVGSLGIVAFALVYPNAVFLIVAGAIAVATIVLTLAIRIQQGRAAGRRRRERASRYRAYLESERERLERIARAQRAALERVHPGAERTWSLVTDRRYLWERRRGDADFGEVRIGLGDVPLAASVRLDLGSDPLVEFEPDLLAEARELVASYQALAHAPVTIPAARLGGLAVVGAPEQARALVRALVCELGAFHAPEDLRIVAWFDAAEEPAWGWMKWLPHTRDSAVPVEGEGRETVALTVDARDLDVLLTQLVRPRLEHLERVREDARYGEAVSFQQVVAIVDGYDPDGPLAGIAALDEILERGAEIGILLVAVVDEAAKVPSRVGARIVLAEGGWLTYAEAGPDARQERSVRAGEAEVELCEAIARALAPLRLRVRRGRTATVDSEGLLDLLQIRSAQRIDPAATWARGDRALLRAPIGIYEDGSAAVLDLREAAEGGMGPHGLVVGATGSGKSELLRTLVSGLALTHPPEELAFVLVDYKGGATFAGLEALPHVAGVITNLERDLTLVDRMREALFGELERRQRVLQESGGFDRVADYQAYRAAAPDAGLPPLPVLVLVVDEFGELLTARPDFVDLFVSVGRTGRSLGMHLVLATQRPEEGRIRGLESHLRYRICLRTFSPEESLVALGTREAFELPPLPGLGYLKVDAAVQRFKAALATRPYREHRPSVDEPSVVRAFTVTGAGPELARVGTGGDGSEADAERAGDAYGTDGRPAVRTEMEIVVDALARTTDPARRARQVWLPPLPAALPLDAVLSTEDGEAVDGRGMPEWLEPRLGLLDRPRRQEQLPFSLGFTGAGGHLAVVGAPRSGKSTLLQTLVASLALAHDPRDLHVYAVDLGGGGLHALANLPHVGAVYGRGDREEIHRLVRELRALVQERIATFRRHRFDAMRSFHEARRAATLPRAGYGEVFLVVDNWGLFAQDFEELEPEIADLVAAGLHYGVHVVVASNRWNDVRLSIRDNIGGRLELRLNDPLESELDRHAARALPEHMPGRGITKDAEQFQAALPRLDGRADVGGLALATERLVSMVAERWHGSGSAPAIRMLPREVVPEALPDPSSEHEPGVAVGVEEFGLEPLYLDLFASDPHFLVFGDGECGKTTLLRAWIERLAARYRADEVQIAVVDYRRQLLGAVDDEHLFGYAWTPEGATELAGRVVAELSARLPAADLSGEELARGRSWSGPELVLFVDDYDLVSTATNPLAGLVELLAHGRDVGFHVVLARRVGGLARSAFEPFLQRIRELATPGIVMSGDPQEGPVIGAQKAAPLPPGRGYLVRRSRIALVQTVLVPVTEAERPARREAEVR